MTAVEPTLLISIEFMMTCFPFHVSRVKRKRSLKSDRNRLDERTAGPHFRICCTDMDTAEVRAMAEEFFGYGRWEAPFWFIGPEPGMKGSGDSLQLRAEAWQRLGSGALLDCKAHHAEFKFKKWHQPNAPTQPTWRQLTRLLLSFKAQHPQPSETDVIREYQINEWGNKLGETCVIELSGLASPSLKADRDRVNFLASRVDRIKREIVRVQDATSGLLPVFVVMYGARNLQEWKLIAGGDLDKEGFRWMNGTLAVVAAAPTAHGVGNSYWEACGMQMAEAYRRKS